MRYLLLLLSCIRICSASIDFDVSMQRDKYPHLLRHERLASLYKLAKELYQTHNPDTVPYKEQAIIPKIIHHIWLGSPLSEEYQQLRQTWIDMHPKWTFIFWTDNPKNYSYGKLITTFDELSSYLNNPLKEKFLVVDVKGLVFDNKKYFDQADNYGERSDILKWEIVYRFGGMYVDTDFECLKPFDQLHHQYDFYTGMQPLDTNCVQLGAALYAARPGYPTLKLCVERIKQNRHLPQIITRTGPLHFTNSFILTKVDAQTREVVLPATYLYPCGYEQRGMDKSVWLRPESYAVHHWAGSWLKPGGHVKP